MSMWNHTSNVKKTANISRVASHGLEKPARMHASRHTQVREMEMLSSSHCLDSSLQISMLTTSSQHGITVIART